ncbi:MAG TPA: TIGR01777 family oxidoreductase [Gammaproteobacteria bacterium]|nr:TIGR01777 family oxidoreductase [Gammaproteobacteria bacterium]
MIGGGSGFIGSALTKRFRARGDTVTWISRTAGPDRITWQDVERGAIPACDAVINLAGQHILDVRRRWNDAYREEVLRSRVDTTRALVRALNEMAHPPAVFVSTAGKCFYGTPEIGAHATYPELDEHSTPMGMDFPAELVAQWERAAEGIDAARIRHVSVRIGVVLGAIDRTSTLGKLWRVGRAHGFLPIIRLPFCLGLGAIMGHGRQPVPWIHIDDAVELFAFVVDSAEARGRYNAVAPGIVSNRDFTLTFARHLRRPVIWSAPAWLVRFLVSGDRASILLEGQNVRPKRTLEAGFRFRYAALDDAMDDLVRVTF